MSPADPLPIDLGDGAIVRRYTMGDLDELWSAVQSERDRIGEWMPWVEATTSKEAQGDWLRSVVDRADSMDGCGIYLDGEFAGSVGLSWDPFRIAGEIGYWVRAAFEGRGLVTRAGRAFTDAALSDIGLNRVVIRAAVGNERSRAVAERLGYQQEGIERGAGRGSSGYQDMVVYVMLADEWGTVAAPGRADGREDRPVRVDATRQRPPE
ncbi:MAG: GNAT family N-acetyltransferase [Actinomycetota bacterium]